MPVVMEINKMKENPFRYGTVVTGEYFTNREEEIKEISNELISGQSIILISPRRYGKTSIIINVVNKIKCPYIKFDMQLITDELDLGNSLIRKTLSLNKFEKIKYLLKNLRIQPAVQYNPVTEEVAVVFNSGEKNVATYLEDALELPQKVAKSLKKRLVIIFDEFQEIRKISKNLEKKMRAIFQYHIDVSYVFIGSQEHMIRDIFENKNNPFYKFGKQIQLNEISHDKIKSFIIERFSSRGIDATETVNEILKITNGHPYYTQQLCHEIFIVCDKKTLHMGFVEKAIGNILSNHNVDYQKWWNDFDKTEKKIMIGICSGTQNPTSGEFISKYNIKSASTSGSALKRLLERGILVKKNGESYSIEDPFWEKWLTLNREY
jgi:hypothetical protein